MLTSFYRRLKEKLNEPQILKDSQRHARKNISRLRLCSPLPLVKQGKYGNLQLLYAKFGLQRKLDYTFVIH